MKVILLHPIARTIKEISKIVNDRQPPGAAGGVVLQLDGTLALQGRKGESFFDKAKNFVSRISGGNGGNSFSEPNSVEDLAALSRDDLVNYLASFNIHDSADVARAKSVFGGLLSSDSNTIIEEVARKLTVGDEQARNNFIYLCIQHSGEDERVFDLLTTHFPLFNETVERSLQDDNWEEMYVNEHIQGRYDDWINLIHDEIENSSVSSSKKEELKQRYNAGSEFVVNGFIKTMIDGGEFDGLPDQSVEKLIDLIQKKLIQRLCGN